MCRQRILSAAQTMFLLCTGSKVCQMMLFSDENHIPNPLCLEIIQKMQWRDLDRKKNLKVWFWDDSMSLTTLQFNSSLFVYTSAAHQDLHSTTHVVEFAEKKEEYMELVRQVNNCGWVNQRFYIIKGLKKSLHNIKAQIQEEKISLTQTKWYILILRTKLVRSLWHHFVYLSDARTYFLHPQRITVAREKREIYNG